MKRMYIKLITIFIIIISGMISAQDGSPLSFVVGEHAFSDYHSMYLTAGQHGAKNFALTKLSLGELTPCAPEIVTQNYISQQKNPLYDAKISQLMILGTKPVLVSADEAQAIHYIVNLESPENPMQIISTETIYDAHQEPTGGIIGLSWGQTQTAAGSSYSTYVFAAVKPNQGMWGQSGSGIAFLKLDQEVVEVKDSQKNDQDKKDSQNKNEKNEDTKKVFHHYFNILDAQTGKVCGNKAYPLDICLPPYAAIVQDEQMQHLDLYWEPNFQRLYIPLRIKTDSNARSNQGACALLVGAISDDDRLELHPIVDPGVFSAEDDGVIGVAGPDKTVSLKKVRAMYTSTGLPYLIVLGGIGDQSGTSMKVSAFPLTNHDNLLKYKELRKDYNHGVIARKGEIPVPRFLSGRYGRFRGRLLQEPVKTNNDFYTYDQRAVAVGARASLPHDVTDLIVLKDCVYAVVPNDGNGQQAGIFYSQALFNHDGSIVSWTPWRRAAGSHTDSINILMEPSRGIVSFFDNNQPTIRDVGWSYVRPEGQREIALADVLRDEFDQGSGGAQGLFDFDSTTHGISGQDKTSLMIATGNKKVLLIQSGAEDERGIFMPMNNFIRIQSTDGTLNQKTNEPVSIISLRGGVLDELGPITCAEVVHDKNQAWIFVGGVYGVAMLSDAEGNGWSTVVGIGKGFSGLSSNFSFKKFGNYSYVRKIVQDGNALYILTRDCLERLSLNSHEISSGTILGTSTAFNAKFNDIIVSGPCALLATTDGLFRVGNGRDIQKEVTGDAVGWHPISLPAAGPCILSLRAISPSGKETGFAYDGQVYVLSGLINAHESFVHRLFVRNVEKTGVTDSTVCLMADYGVRDHLSNLIAFGGYRNNYATDGLLHVSTRGGSSPMIHAFPSFTGGKLVIESKGIPIQLPHTDSSYVHPIVKNSADGSWLIAGDFGICTYQ
jgi:hypothetical protein